MKKCLTKQSIFNEVSVCLVEEPECGFAHKFGFSFMCCHPDHKIFNAQAVGAMSKDEELELRYELWQKRREKFIANLDENSKKYFCEIKDFHGQLFGN